MLPIGGKIFKWPIFQEVWNEYVAVPEKATKVQLTDSDLKQVIQIQVTENESAWSNRLEGVEARFKAIENRLDTLAAKSEALEKSAKAAEVKTSDLHLDVKKLLTIFTNEDKEAKPKDKAPSP